VLEIRRVRPGDREVLDQVHGVFEAVRAAETPELAPVPERHYAASLAHPPTDTAYRCYAAVEDGFALGVLWILMPLRDNDHYAEVALAVRPDRRRRGVGTALLDHLHDVARDEGRSELIVHARAAVEGGPSRPDVGARFLERRGFTVAQTEIERSLRLDAADPEVEEALWAEAIAAAADYEPVSWIGRCPDEYLDGLGRIDSLIYAEVPLGDRTLRPRTVDAASIRAREASAQAGGHDMVRTLAIHKATGEIAANTLIYAAERQAHVHQAITIVDPAHRGHRLGLLVKLANHRQLRERLGHMTTVWTSNADTNTDMITINDRLGFHPVDARVAYKRNLEV
jgi:GNAT superfamily N-acetyltransferase